nr:MAG TPA: hypothetical protein [Caudoviricetes sp.]
MKKTIETTSVNARPTFDALMASSKLAANIADIDALLKTADSSESVAEVEKALEDAQKIVDDVNSREIAVSILNIVSGADAESAWRLFLSDGTYQPFKVTKKTTKGKTTHSCIQGDMTVVPFAIVFTAFSETHSGATMTENGWMTAIKKFYWKFAVNKAQDLGVAKLALSESARKELFPDGKIPSANKLEDEMNVAALALCPQFSGLVDGKTLKLYRRNLVAINDYLVNGKVFKATIANENKCVDALIRCMILTYAGQNTELVSRAKIYKADKQ